MPTLALGLRQVPPLPEQHVMLITGVPCSGKSTVAAHIATQAALAGQRVVYIDPDHTKAAAAQRIVRAAFVGMLQQDKLSNIRLVCVGDLPYYSQHDIDVLLVEAIEHADFVVFEEVGRVYSTARANARGGWQKVVAQTCRVVEKMKRPMRVVFTFQANRNPIAGTLPVLEAPIPPDHDAVTMGQAQMYLVRRNSEFIGATLYEVRKKYRPAQ